MAGYTPFADFLAPDNTSDVLVLCPPADSTPLPGCQPQGDKKVPTVASWADFLRALKAGKINANVHSLIMPAGLIRGNLVPVAGGSPGPAAQRVAVAG